MEVRHRILGVMFTMTTYGVWLRGDERGWVEDGRLFPRDPEQESADRQRLKYPPFYFAKVDLPRIGEAIGRSLIDRLEMRVLALTIRTWHVHFVVAESDVGADEVAKCAKDAVRYLLRPGRPIWGDKFDKRFCSDEATLQNRITYVERHNLEDGLPAKPWTFIK